MKILNTYGVNYSNFRSLLLVLEEFENMKTKDVYKDVCFGLPLQKCLNEVLNNEQDNYTTPSAIGTYNLTKMTDVTDDLISESEGLEMRQNIIYNIYDFLKRENFYNDHFTHKGSLIYRLLCEFESDEVLMNVITKYEHVKYECKEKRLFLDIKNNIIGLVPVIPKKSISERKYVAECIDFTKTGSLCQVFYDKTDDFKTIDPMLLFDHSKRNPFYKIYKKILKKVNESMNKYNITNLYCYEILDAIKKNEYLMEIVNNCERKK